MRNLIIIRGPERSGKTKLVYDCEVSPWHVDLNAIIRLYSSPTMDGDGNIKLPHLVFKRACDQLCAVLRNKMEHSEFVVCEITDGAVVTERGTHHISSALCQTIRDLATSHRYKTTLIESGDMPDDTQARDIDADKTLHISNASGYIRNLSSPVEDVEDVDAIVAIGDIHGYADTLSKMLNPLRGRKNIAYVFTGDYISKGTKPAAALRLLQEFQQEHPNCYMLCGNHDDLLEKWAYNNSGNKDIFERESLPDFTDQKYTKAEARSFLSQVRDHVVLQWKGRQITFTHGGLSGPSNTLGYLSGTLKRNGYGFPGTDIDRLWENNTAENKDIQVHGHRNHQDIRVHATSRSINLEGIDAFSQISGVVLKSHGVHITPKGFSLPVEKAHKANRKSNK